MPEPLIERAKVRQYARGVIHRGRKARSVVGRVTSRQFPYAPPSVPAGVELPADDDNIGAKYDADWARSPAARAARSAIVETVLRPSIALVAKPERHGLDRLNKLDEDENCVFVANHHSHIDTSLLLTSIPQPWRRRLVVAAAADYFFTTRAKATLSALAIGAFPLDRSGTGRTTANQAASVLDDGNSLLIFPEGGRSPDGWGQPFKGGAAYLALRCDVPVVPVYLQGTGRVWKKGQRLPKPSPTRVIFGDPIRARDGENTRRLAVRIEGAVASLGDELTTDWYQARMRFHAQGAPSLEGPEAASWRRAWALSARSEANRSRRPTWPR